MRSLSSRRAPWTLVGLCALVALAAWGLHACGEDGPRPLAGPFEKVYVIDFEGPIEGLMHAYVKRHVDTAVGEGYDCIVLRIDSPGGTVFHSKKIGDLLVAVPDTVHTVAWIPVKAISGGAMVSIACREIIMAPGSSIGDSQPIVPGADGRPVPVGEKYESPLRTWFRNYAHRNGYPQALVEAMVSAHIDVLRIRVRGTGEEHYVRGRDFREADDDAELIPGTRKSDLQQIGSAVVREGELLTMTADEALALDFLARPFASGLPADEAAVLAALRAPGSDLTIVEMSFSEEASKWLLKLAGILSAVVVLSLALLLWQGPGVMTIIGGVALVLVLMITFTAEQLHGFPIFLLLLGVGLLVAEIYLVPGFGIPGVLGIGAMAFGLLLLATGRGIDEVGTIEHDQVITFGLQFLLTVLAGLLTLLALSRFFPRIGPARRMILVPSGAPAGGPAPESGFVPPLGATGVARSPLRTAGSAEFDGRLVDVVSDGAFLGSGVAVRVIRIEGARVTVTAVEERPS